jgi:hypothetical protein
MAYMNQETKANIVAAVKPILKKYGIKASFGVRHHSTIVVSIKSGRIDFIGNFIETIRSKPGPESRRTLSNRVTKDQCLDVNQYWLTEQFNGKALECLEEIFKAIKTAGNWFDKSDAQTDYFNTAFYMDVNIGKWNQPYIVA